MLNNAFITKLTSIVFIACFQVACKNQPLSAPLIPSIDETSPPSDSTYSNSIKSISTSAFGSTCALNSDGKIACYGYSGYGNVGRIQYVNANPILIDSDTNYQSISVGIHN